MQKRPDHVKGLGGWSPLTTITKTSFSGERSTIMYRREDHEMVAGKFKCGNNIHLPIN